MNFPGKAHRIAVDGEASQKTSAEAPRVQNETSDIVLIRIVSGISLDNLAWDEISSGDHPHTPCAI